MRCILVSKWQEVSVVNTESISGETISETLGYVSSYHLNWFFIRKSRAVEESLDRAMQKLQIQAFKDGADAVVNVRTNIEMQGQYFLYTRVNVFIEGTLISLQ